MLHKNLAQFLKITVITAWNRYIDPEWGIHIWCNQ